MFWRHLNEKVDNFFNVNPRKKHLQRNQKAIMQKKINDTSEKNNRNFDEWFLFKKMPTTSDRIRTWQSLSCVLIKTTMKWNSVKCNHFSHAKQVTCDVTLDRARFRFWCRFDIICHHGICIKSSVSKKIQTASWY